MAGLQSFCSFLWQGMEPVAQSTEGLWEPCRAVYCAPLPGRGGERPTPTRSVSEGWAEPWRGEHLPKVTQLDERHVCVYVHTCVPAYMLRLSIRA